VGVRWREWVWVVEIPAWEAASFFLSFDSWHFGFGLALLPMVLAILWAYEGRAEEKRQDAWEGGSES